MADAATDAEIVVDDRFAGTIEFDGVFRAVGGTGPGHATFAEVGDLVVGLHARRAGFVDYAEILSFCCCPLRSRALRAYSDSGVSSSVSSDMSKPISGKICISTRRAPCVRSSDPKPVRYGDSIRSASGRFARRAGCLSTI